MIQSEIFEKLGLNAINPGVFVGSTILQTSDKVASYNPSEGTLIGEVGLADSRTYADVIRESRLAFDSWKNVPAPKRGDLIRQIGDALRDKKAALGALVALEMGKILQEGLGEVQEMIDICDFSVGLSRQLYGLSMHSEREKHRMLEQWHPIGVVGVISAFNFPVAVWAWNAMVAVVCGNTCVWKPSDKTPLTSVACQNIIADVLQENQLPNGLFCLVNGDQSIGKKMAKDEDIALLSATGSTRMGRDVGTVVAARFGKSILELGGNNALIVTPNASIDLALNAIVFGSVGTCGQRCTTTRRLIVHEEVIEEVIERLKVAYSSLPIGHALDKDTIVGPLIDEEAVLLYSRTIQRAVSEGGKVLIGNKVLTRKGFFVKPTIILVENHYKSVQEESFVPVLYLIKYSGTVSEAIKIQNGVKQGLSSAIFSDNIRETEFFLSALGSDCGIANVNIGTSGAEIGGAFGGEKETGGGREAGSDAWKVYMRRQTNTINYSEELPLAQGINFKL
jgi:aldehyde dehydrogenase (NAD+)